jgi:hypothetical protein
MPVNVTLEFDEAYLLAERAWLAFSKGVHQARVVGEPRD